MSKTYKDGLAAVCAIIEGPGVCYETRIQGIGAVGEIIMPWHILDESGEAHWTITLKESPDTAPTVKCPKCGK